MLFLFCKVKLFCNNNPNQKHCKVLVLRFWMNTTCVYWVTCSKESIKNALTKPRPARNVIYTVLYKILKLWGGGGGRGAVKGEGSISINETPAPIANVCRSQYIWCCQMEINLWHFYAYAVLFLIDKYSLCLYFWDLSHGPRLML